MHAQLFGGFGHGKVIEADFRNPYRLMTRHFPASPPLFASVTIDALPLHRDEITTYRPIDFEYRGACVSMYVEDSMNEKHARTLWRDMLEHESKFYPLKPLPDWQYGDKL